MNDLVRWLATRPLQLHDGAARAEAAKLYPEEDLETAWALVESVFGRGSVLADAVRSGMMSDGQAASVLRREFPGLSDEIRDAALARGYFESR